MAGHRYRGPNTRLVRQRAAHRAAQKRDALRCQLVAEGVRCPRAATRDGYCAPCWKGGEAGR